MPWKSKAQAAWGHSPTGVKALGGKAAVSEWDAATPKGSLPAKVQNPEAIGALTKTARKKGANG
jgi:hypothetical protein